jgi:1-deoxy-D-xylulose-5-phosphate synthase
MKIFSEIPTDHPKTPILDKINVPEDIKNLTSVELKSLADDVRAHMLYSVGQSGGHLGGGLGVVELTVVLQYLYSTPDDKIIWDVGHQAYPHKILTGRKNSLTSIRHKMGLLLFQVEKKVHMMLLVLVTQAHRLVLLLAWQLPTKIPIKKLLQ